MLWRACRGNVFLRQAMIESPLEDPSNVSICFYACKIIFIISFFWFNFAGRSGL